MRIYDHQTSHWVLILLVLRAALDVYENEPEVHPGLIKSRHTVSIYE